MWRWWFSRAGRACGAGGAPAAAPARLEGDLLVGGRADGLHMAVELDLKVIRGQAGHRLAVSIQHADVDGDKGHAATEDRGRKV